jgi:hypothetical protein
MNVRRQRAALRIVKPNKVNQPVRLFAYTQESPKWETWRGRTVTLRTAELMVAAGEAERLTRRLGREIVTIYKAKTPTQPSLPSPCTLTMATSHAVSISGGRQKLTRGEQAHVDKVTEWPFVPVLASQRRSTIRPASGERERKAHEAMMRRAQGVRPKAREFRSKHEIRTMHHEFQPAA